MPTACQVFSPKCSNALGTSAWIRRRGEYMTNLHRVTAPVVAKLLSSRADHECAHPHDNRCHGDRGRPQGERAAAGGNGDRELQDHPRRHRRRCNRTRAQRCRRPRHQGRDRRWPSMPAIRARFSSSESDAWHVCDQGNGQRRRSPKPSATPWILIGATDSTVLRRLRRRCVRLRHPSRCRSSGASGFHDTNERDPHRRCRARRLVLLSAQSPGITADRPNGARSAPDRHRF